MASAGRLNRFKERHDIVGKVLSGESASLDSDSVSLWIATNAANILEKYTASDVYNADETGFSTKCCLRRRLISKESSATEASRAKSVSPFCSVRGDPAIRTIGAIFGAEKMLFWSTIVSELDFGAAWEQHKTYVAASFIWR